MWPASGDRCALPRQSTKTAGPMRDPTISTGHTMPIQAAPIDSVVAVSLVEYAELKREQVTRMGDRDHFFYAMLIGCGAIAAVALENTDHWIALLGVPIVSIVISALYFANDNRVSEISNYIRRELSPRLAKHLHCEPCALFGWEEHRLAEAGRAARKRAERLFLRCSFLIPSLAAGAVCSWLCPWQTASRLAVLLPFLTPLLMVERNLAVDVEESPSNSLLANTP